MRLLKTRTAHRLLVLAPLAALLASGAVFASDPPPKPKADAHGEAKPAETKAPEAKPAAGHGDAHGAAPEAKAPARAAPAADPLLVLRDKLSEKLGAAKPEGARSNYALQISNRVSGEMQVAAKPPSAVRSAGGRPADGAAAGGHGAAPGGGHAAHWSYAGEAGPEAWGSLKPEFVQCSAGTRQSPIDIRGGIAVDLDPVQFDYRPTGFSVVDNGHTIQVNVGAGNTIQVMGRRFELVQFHFHRPSEERINGRQFDMVAHLVHKSFDGKLAVVAVLLDRGGAQPLIQTIWNNLPLEKGDELQARGAIDLNNLLPQDRRYFTYMGSLTTPPCSEGVLWMVMQQPVMLSTEQIDIFARLYPMNARPIQSASGRLIKQSQ